MNDNLLFLGVAAAGLFLLSKKKAGSGTATVQTNPASRNPNTGIGNGPNSLNTQIANAASAVTNGAQALTGILKTAGLGTGTTPGATVGVATTQTPSGGSGNPSFDAQDAVANASGSDMGEYSDNFLIS